MTTEPSGGQAHELQRLFNESRERSKSLQRTQLGLTALLLVVIVGSLAAIYDKGASMYTPEKLQASLEPQIEILRPDVEATMKEVVRRTAPHYVRLGRERFQQVLPKVSAELEAEALGLTERLTDDAVARISTSFGSIQEERFEQIRAQFPEVTEERFSELTKKWSREIQSDTNEALAQFHERAMSDFANVNNAIEAFGPNKYDDFGRDELLRYYAHLWLTVIDEDVLSGAQESGEERRDG